mmetsp:Transcript_17649/g.28565  ORF Transcript_17649/g.28565 Transcript_17649/m.28565 type:complete len:163 (-) Transcript_17649:964-1452(-)|eukprot:CAMPEP_0203766190 /NCGR_PEP_ID=MMETSP0099_2-20121227/276_1 /ASSEMBLY_ACC=CAM_ASM_000209 /TAXON_ID=96639 /ORGANISM=" , Strain NY0313808BC1" /LENGTH=162 /DNA_ID=CAMNT_0050662505 /DNA_START=62 /DNA_END=550 /DNA_ORIENTATION=+
MNRLGRVFVRWQSTSSRRGAFFKSLGADTKSDGSWTDNAIPKKGERRLKSLHLDAFKVAGEECVDLVARGLEELKGENPNLIVCKKGDSVEARFSDDANAFIVSMHPDKRQLQLLTPFSGIHNYEYDIESKRWIGHSDGHDFEGLLIRDLMRCVYGVPIFFN